VADAAPISLLQITDLHLLPAVGARLLGVDTAASLDAVLRAALAERAPDALLASGDLVHEPTPAAYARVHATIARHFRGPMLWLAGNHDDGATLAQARPAIERLDLGDWSVIGIDTHVDGAEGGHVADAELARLRAQLAATRARFVIVAGHHPPVELGMPWLDPGCIDNGAELLALLDADARVKAYVCGHVHQDTATRRGRLDVLSTPSTCFQFVGRTARFSVDETPPGWRWLDLASDGTLATRVGRATDFAITLDLSSFRNRPATQDATTHR
jgi:Icc protein